MASCFIEAENSFAAAFCAAAGFVRSNSENTAVIVKDTANAVSVFVLRAVLFCVSIISVLLPVIIDALIIIGENLTSPPKTALA